jgi:tetratricopeptide (TPR) repeat protein
MPFHLLRRAPRLLVLAACLLLPGEVLAQAVTAPEAIAWRQDLATMRAKMEERHKDLFHHVSQGAFDADVAALDARIPQLSRDEIVVGLMRLVASVGDGHTAIAPTRDKAIGFHRLPVALYDFEDGLFVRAADRAHADLVGARVLRIGNASTADAMRAASAIVAQDNAMDVRFLAPMLLAMPEVLHGLGLSRSGNEATLTVEQGGRRRTVTLQALDPVPMLPADTDTSWMPQPGWVDLRDAAGTPAPTWLRDASAHFRLEHWPDRHAIYAQVNQVNDDEDESFAAFSARLLAMVDAHPGDRLILDLRLNRGGNGTLLKPLEVGLLKSAADRPGGIVVLMGRSTWSAAQFLLNFLQAYTQAAFVGEPSGSRGNIYGDSRKTTLPNSGITVRTSVYYWQDWMPWDTRQWTAPTLSVPLTSAAYRANRDPALDAALAYVPAPTLLEVLDAAIARGGADAAVAAYHAWMADPLHKYADTEEALLVAGSPLLEKQPGEALKLFALDAEANPASYRAWYAVGAAQLGAGDKAAALATLEKAHALNPKDYDLAMLLEQAR